MKKILLATVALAAFGLSAPASAADLGSRIYTKAPPVAAVYDWTGFYIGANAGWGSGRNCWAATSGLGIAVNASEGCHDADGGTFGAQVGYRWQSSAWVFGIEAQGNWADFSGSNDSTFFTVRNESEIDAFGTLTGQVGYAWNNALLYVKSGAAVVRHEYTGFALPSGASFDSAKDTQWGGLLGVGLEYGFAPNWSVGVEYAHIFMGDRDISPATAAGTVARTDTVDGDIDLITLRVNYRFGGPVVARY